MHIRQPSDFFQFLPAPHTHKNHGIFSFFRGLKKYFLTPNRRLKIPAGKNTTYNILSFLEKKLLTTTTYCSILQVNQITTTFQSSIKSFFKKLQKVVDNYKKL